MLLRDGDNKASFNLWNKRHQEDYYTFPDNWREITEREYYAWMTQEPILCVEPRTLQKNKDGSFREGFNKGRAMSAILYWTSYSEGIAVNPPRFGKEVPTYYRFGCEHSFKEEKLNKNFVRKTCSKCGQTEAVDSGD